MSVTRSSGSRARVGLLSGLVILLVVFFVWVGVPGPVRPLSPGSHEPNGTSALVALLEGLGADVVVDVSPADAIAAGRRDVVLVLVDRMDDASRADLSRWAREGGVVVVTDPRSALAPLGAVGSDGSAGTGRPSDDALVESGPERSIPRGVCTLAPLVDQDVESLMVVGWDARLPVNTEAGSCFGDEGRAFLVARDVGDGTIVSLGGPGIWTNEALGRGDNAVVAAALLAPVAGTRVAVLDLAERREAGEETLLDVMPTWTKQVLVQLALAFLVYVWWRSRRLGKPVTEPQPVKVAGSELVAAVGGLLGRAGSPQHAAELLRADLRHDLMARLGLARDLPPDAFYQVLQERCRLDPGLLRWALGPGPVTTDADLVVVARTIDDVRKEVFESVGTAN